jgi:hypothetical protein
MKEMMPTHQTTNVCTRKAALVITEQKLGVKKTNKRIQA